MKRIGFFFLEDGVIKREDEPAVMIPFLEEYLSEEPLKEGSRGENIKSLSRDEAAPRRGPKGEKETDGAERRGRMNGNAAARSEQDRTVSAVPEQRNRAISVKNVTFCYTPDRPVIENFSAVFPSGAITAVTGKNGCGKSTLMKNITGILRPQSGEIMADGENLNELTISQIAEKIGFVMQNPECQILGMTVREEMEMGLKNRGVPDQTVKMRVQQYLEYFELSQYADTFPGHLSIGEKQRLGIAATLAVGADFLILDEPTASLDMRRKNRLGILLESLKTEGKGIILISHDERFNEMYADHVIYMERGGRI